MEPLGLTFGVLAGFFLLLVAVIGAFLLRRYQLNRALGTFDASILLPPRGWRVGVCRYTDLHLEWLSLLSLSPLPKYRFLRSSLSVSGWRPPTEDERVRIQPGAIVVQLVHRGEPFDLAMKYDVYAGLSSWIEAGPVIGIGTWR
ncbi:DUF2550 domain-containing protein [uncultured Arthrobacter sp.]|uniref:DUF2550 domain-containing protein n=1 Tax=uncultured Arthrobacter sp. TaxID=114050 RepID=UPI002606AA88|nr:DUF2550 domain-containing protein [uncultured Arthrobacter sp.]